MIKKTIFFLLSLLLTCCTNTSTENKLNLKSDKTEITSGESLNVKYNINPEIVKMRAALISGNGRAIEIYNFQPANGIFNIRRAFSNLDSLNYSKNNTLEFLAFNKDDQIILSDQIPIILNPSIVIKSLCATANCNVLTGNVIGNLPQKITIETFGMQPVSYKYIINTKKDSVTFLHNYNSPVSNDYLDNIVWQPPSEDESFYLTSIIVIATDKDGFETMNALPVKVVRPIEIRYDGSYELAQVFEPMPVSGCITGSIDNRIEYNESKSETRENSIDIMISNNWNNSVGLSVSQELTEGIQISQSVGNSVSSTSEQSESTENGWETSQSTGTSNEFSWSTSNGETWDFNNSNSVSTSQTNETQNEINGSVTVGIEGEGSLPLLGKIGGNVSTTGGVRRGWNNSNTNASEKTQGYSIGGNTEKSQSYGSVQSSESTTGLSGAYVVGKSFSNSLETNEEKSNTRVWDMTNGTTNENVVSTGNEESISKAQTSSTSVTTSFNFSVFLPRERKGVFYRQTSRWIREIKIITYDMNGTPKLAGKMLANEWNWAVSMSIGETCQEISIPNNMESAACFIEPCF
jgi:hypothetical protein